jgi:hypothetical protein
MYKRAKAYVTEIKASDAVFLSQPAQWGTLAHLTH